MAGETDSIQEALASVIRSAASPQVQEAQLLLLRRLALEGSVFPTRIPAPRNITELGGYLNLLEQARENDLRTSAIASALGLASPESMSWNDTTPSIGMGSLINDRTGVPDEAGLPLSVPLRTDFAAAWRASVLPRLAELGATLPLWSPPANLPRPSIGGPVPDALVSLGRVTWVAPGAALMDPDVDPVLLGRADTDPADHLEVKLRVTNIAGITAVKWHSIVWDDTANIALVRDVGAKTLAALAPIVSLAGFTVQSGVTLPRNRNELSWGRLTNLTGLLAGVTSLGDELALVWSQHEIAQSAFAKRLNEIWNGTAFA